MSRFQALIWILLGVGLAAGCRKAGRSAADEPKTSAPSRPVSGPLAADEAQMVCLADPAGDTDTDRDVRSQQKRVGERPAKPDEWVLAGRNWVRKARHASDPGFYVNADACAAVAIELEPDYAPAQELRGLVLMNEHKFEEARRLAETVLERDAENVVALGTLSDALLELGRYDEAVAAAQRQMSARPGMAAHARGSYHRWLRGDTRYAKQLIKDALIDRDGRDPEPAAWAFVEAATIYWHQADYEGADAVYAEALKWVPDYPPALLGRGRIAIAQGRAGQAIAHLEKAARLRPSAESLWLLGDARRMQGDEAGAQEAYGRVVELGRRGDSLTLALFYATKNRDIEDALRLVEAERALRGGIYLDDTYAWALYRAGRLDEARRAAERAIRLGTKDARLLYHAGAVRMATGEEASGRKLVQQALALNPHFDATGSAEARALLEEAPRRVASTR